jgi:hypothetical protein
MFLGLQKAFKACKTFFRLAILFLGMQNFLRHEKKQLGHA